MDKKQPYRIVASGKKAERRDYSKVSGHLELPNLVEIRQTPSSGSRTKELGKNVEFIKLAGANHGFMGFNCDEALDAVEGFLRKYI